MHVGSERNIINDNQVFSNKCWLIYILIIRKCFHGLTSKKYKYFLLVRVKEERRILYVEEDEEVQTGSLMDVLIFIYLFFVSPE